MEIIFEICTKSGAALNLRKYGTKFLYFVQRIHTANPHSKRVLFADQRNINKLIFEYEQIEITTCCYVVLSNYSTAP